MTLINLSDYHLYEDLEGSYILGYKNIRYWFIYGDGNVHDAIQRLQWDGWPKSHYPKFGPYLGTLTDLPEFLI